MASLAQLQAEPWWGREVVTAELDWLADELCRRTGQPRTAAGTKGNEAHLSGAHRSQEWILNSAYCTSRSYTVQTGLTSAQLRHVAGLDFTPGVWGSLRNRQLMAQQTSRLLATMKAGQLEGARELYGTVDGRTVTGWNNVTNQSASSDSSHLDHWHLTLDRRRLTDRTLMERILAVALGEDTTMSIGDIVPATGNRNVGTVLSDLWAGEQLRASGFVPTIQTTRQFALSRIEQKLDLVLSKVDVTPEELAAVTAAARAGAEASLASGVDELAEAIAARLVIAEDNPLGEADKPAIVAAVKQALAEGVA